MNSGQNYCIYVSFNWFFIENILLLKTISSNVSKLILSMIKYELNITHWGYIQITDRLDENMVLSGKESLFWL